MHAKVFGYGSLAQVLLSELGSPRRSDIGQTMLPTAGQAFLASTIVAGHESGQRYSSGAVLGKETLWLPS